MSPDSLNIQQSPIFGRMTWDAVPMLHERVIQGEATGVVDAARDPRERTLITADTAATG